jgi:hypothetical protein
LPSADAVPDVDVEVDVDVEPLALLDVVGDPVVDEPHAASDNAVSPMTARSGYFDIAVLGIIDGSFSLPGVRARRLKVERSG